MARSKRKPSGRAKARPVATPSEPEDLEALTSDEAAAADGQDSAQKPEGDAATGDPDATDAPDRADAQASSEDDDGGRGSGGKSGTAAGTKDPVSKKSAKGPVAPSRDKARSEERRVGKEWRRRGGACEKKQKRRNEQQNGATST